MSDDHEGLYRVSGLSLLSRITLRFGSPVTVVEMDGEIDMDNMEDQLKDSDEGLGSTGIRV